MSVCGLLDLPCFEVGGPMVMAGMTVVAYVSSLLFPASLVCMYMCVCTNLTLSDPEVKAQFEKEIANKRVV